MSKLTAIDFYKPTKYNPETLNQIWMSEIADSHDIWCDCNGPFAHLLASIFPPGHQDRDHTINQILKRDFKQCLSGGSAAEGPGGADGDIEKEDLQPIKGEKEESPDAELDALMAAAVEEEEAR